MEWVEENNQWKKVFGILEEKRKKRKKKTKKQTGKGIPFGLIESLAALVLGEVAKPICNGIFGKEKRLRKIKRW